jgi:hypothetical protein
MMLKSNGKIMKLGIVCSAMKVWFMEYHCGLEIDLSQLHNLEYLKSER